MQKLICISMLFLGGLYAHSQQNGTTIEVEITNIESDEGQMLIGLYDSEGNWLKKIKMSSLGKISNGKSSTIFEKVPKGIYAISTFHDENDNGELDTNFLGIPKEDTGASNNAPANFGPPKWEDAKFEVKGNTIKLSIAL